MGVGPALIPRYTRAEAARWLGVAPSTLDHWRRQGLIATPRGDRRWTFVGLAEAWGVQGLRQAGWPLARIAAAVAAYRAAGGPAAALAAHAFYTAQGVEPPEAMRWGLPPHCPRRLMVPMGPRFALRIDPLRCWGQPHLHGVAVDWIGGRLAAGESAAHVAEDFGLSRAAVEAAAAWVAERH